MRRLAVPLPPRHPAAAAMMRAPIRVLPVLLSGWISSVRFTCSGIWFMVHADVRICDDVTPNLKVPGKQTDRLKVLTGTTQSQCCNACVGDQHCAVYIYAPTPESTGKPDCWLLAGTHGRYLLLPPYRCTTHPRLSGSSCVFPSCCGDCFSFCRSSCYFTVP